MFKGHSLIGVVGVWGSVVCTPPRCPCLAGLVRFSDQWNETFHLSINKVELKWGPKMTDCIVVAAVCSAATEGKRLAEQLVASFAASSDPVGDAGECLASAALWLQTMKSRMQTGESGSLAKSSLSCLNSNANSLGLSNPPLNGVSLLSQPHISGNSGVGSPGPGGLGSLAINSGLSHNSNLGNYLARGSSPGAVGSSPVARGIMNRPGLRFEDFKDRPSDFLRVQVHHIKQSTLCTLHVGQMRCKLKYLLRKQKCHISSCNWLELLYRWHVHWIHVESFPIRPTWMYSSVIHVVFMRCRDDCFYCSLTMLLFVRSTGIQRQ